MHILWRQHKGTVQTQIYELFDGIYRLLHSEAFGRPHCVFVILCHHTDKFDILCLCKHR